MLSFDYSGKNGVDGAIGYHGISGIIGISGQDGSNGQNGTDGNAATNIDLVLSVDSNRNKIILNELNQRAIYDNLIFGDENNNINLIANGGHAGHGGYGGDGGRGGDGQVGRDATRYSEGTNGSPGGKGGDGGNGGDGGSGGDGGTVNVICDPQDMDLLMIVNQVSYKAGHLGQGSHAGNGGAGGFGGRGGCGCSWTETNSKRISHYTNPGGSSGSPGFPGRAGQNGRDGSQGSDGTFSYSVGGSKYSSRYDLKIDKVSAVVSDDGIIEPGETLQLNAMDIINVGGMHTPVAQRIALYLQNNQWINFNPLKEIIIPTSLQALQYFKITEDNPMVFKINDYNETTNDAVLKSTALIDYRARVERVNKEFKTITSQTNLYEIRFPVEMSQVQILRSMTRNEESPFAIGILNRSTKPIGIDHNRLLNFRLMLVDTKQTVDFIPKMIVDQEKVDRNSSLWGQNARRQQNFISPNIKDDYHYIIEQEFITTLAPNERKVISGTIKLKDFDLPLYSNIRMQAKLDLGHIHNQDSVFQNIQTRNFNIQITEGYDSNPNADFLMIFNSETPSSFIHSIKNFEKDFETKVDFWNISNYQGFNYDYVGSLNKPLSEIYKDKVVIILDNEYSLINSGKTNAVKEIGNHHIIKSVKDYKINTYILGPFSSNSEFLLKSLRNNYVSFITRHQEQSNETQLDSVDKYCIIKLLPFAKKLEYLKKSMKKFEDAQIVLQAIISDLCDEYQELSQQNLNAEQLEEKIKKWNQILTFNFIEVMMLTRIQRHSNRSLDPSNYNQISVNQVITIEDQERMQQSPNTQIDNNLTTLEEILLLENAQKIINFFINYLIKLQCSLKNLLLPRDQCSPSTIYVNSYCCNIIDKLLLNFSRYEIDMVALAYMKQIEFLDKVAVFEVYQIPQKQMYQQSEQSSNLLRQNNLFMESERSTLGELNENEIQQIEEEFLIEDGSFNFFNNQTEELEYDKRMGMINKFESRIKFDKN